jgi:YesN/AraC family two-component response regulator
VRDHFTDAITLTDIASITNMAPTAFCKYFKNKTQKTFSNFVNEVRIGYAYKSLFDGGLTIPQICYKYGFNNLTDLSNNFSLPHLGLDRVYVYMQ